MKEQKDPIAAFRGAGRNRYSVEKLISDRQKEREDEAREEQGTTRQKRDLRELRGKIGFAKDLRLQGASLRGT
jgi:hypothetical protein